MKPETILELIEQRQIESYGVWRKEDEPVSMSKSPHSFVLHWRALRALVEHVRQEERHWLSSLIQPRVCKINPCEHTSCDALAAVDAAIRARG